MSSSVNRDTLNGKFYELCCSMDSSQAELETAIQGIHDSGTVEKATRITVDFLIAHGAHPDWVQESCAQRGIELPGSIYTDWGLLEALGKSSFLGSVKANIQAIRLGGTRWLWDNSRPLLGTWAMIEMILSNVQPRCCKRGMPSS